MRPRADGLGPDGGSGVERRHVDPATASADDLRATFQGADSLICALGVPTVPGVDAGAYARDHLADVTARTVDAAIDAGVTRIVLVSSFMATWDRMRPELGVAAHHPYVAARIAEAERAVALGEARGVDVCVVEVPFVFGAGEGEDQRWRAILFDRCRGPFVLFPSGGSSVITSQQLAEALVGAVENGRHGARYPLADMDLPWREMIAHIHSGLGRRPPILGAPTWLAGGLVARAVRDLQAKGRLGGLDPEHLLGDLLSHHLYVDAARSREVLRYRPGGVPQAIQDAARAEYGMPLEERGPLPQFAAGRRSR